jgi:hypothetical protein
VEILNEIGTLAWSNKTGGKLSRSEREALLKQVVSVQASIMASEQFAGVQATDAGLNRMDLERIRVPDSRTARHAEDLTAQLCRPVLASQWRMRRPSISRPCCMI